MTSITTVLKKLTLNCYLLIQKKKSGYVYEEFFKHKHLFDFSNFSKDSKFYDGQNEMIIGKMKDVYKGIPINKFVGLKSKMHSVLSDHGKESNTAKGIKNATELKMVPARDIKLLLVPGKTKCNQNNAAS